MLAGRVAQTKAERKIGWCIFRLIDNLQQLLVYNKLIGSPTYAHILEKLKRAESLNRMMELKLLPEHFSNYFRATLVSVKNLPYIAARIREICRLF